MNATPEDIRLSLQRAVALLQDSLGNGSMIGLAETVSAVLGWSAAVMDPALRVLSGGTKVPLRESERNAIEGCRAGVLARAADRSLSVCEPGMAASELYLPLRGRGEQLLGILCLYRGQKELDVDALAEGMVKLSAFAAEQKDSIAEMDLNPVVVYEKGMGIMALDALIVRYES